MVDSNSRHILPLRAHISPESTVRMSLLRLVRQCASRCVLLTTSRDAITLAGGEQATTALAAAEPVIRRFSTTQAVADKTIAVTYHDEKDNSTKTVQVAVGKNLMEAAHDNDIDLEGACEGSLACSTCHIVLESQEMFDKLPEADDDENDMLDLAFGLTEVSWILDIFARLSCSLACSLTHLRTRSPTCVLAYSPTYSLVRQTSRLGCQVIASEELDGVSVRIPSATRNFAVDGHIPKPH